VNTNKNELKMFDQTCTKINKDDLLYYENSPTMIIDLNQTQDGMNAYSPEHIQIGQQTKARHLSKRDSHQVK
jgi:hypothetical protein